ncbi:EPIDERMAL PATTERNING FACTOR-like protein 6 [Nymphaea colorata]|nr:EPIDERMAL PATTERNING FACTOR-like protein 6 [Nymphaea colorata]
MLLQSKILAWYVTISILVVIMTILQIVVCLPVSCRLKFLAHDNAQRSDTTFIQKGSYTTKTSRLSGDEHWRRNKLVVVYGVSALGSRPPRCLNKCGECRPCDAFQVPAPGTVLQYSNYEPEEWKCKCGANVFDP